MTTPRRFKNVRTAISVALPLILVTGACRSLPERSDFRVGMSRDSVVSTFGEPDQRQSMVKQEEPIWGAIEEFWGSVAIGSKVDIWSYKVEGGTMELYFVDDSSRVTGTGFAPEGAVF